jgi:ankyrin repeat protein
LVDIFYRLAPDTDVNKKTSDGNTPLMFAAMFGNYDVAKYLLEEQKADVAIRNNAGETALSLSKKNGHKNISLLLQDYGAKA